MTDNLDVCPACHLSNGFHKETCSINTPCTVANTYRPPSIADGTVAAGLIEGLQHLMDEYGEAGVKSTLDEMTNTPSTVADAVLAVLDAAIAWHEDPPAGYAIEDFCEALDLAVIAYLATNHDPDTIRRRLAMGERAEQAPLRAQHAHWIAGWRACLDYIRGS